MDFWDGVDRLVRTSQPIIERPKGSVHPRYPNVIYPLDYGYLDGTTAGDGAGIDIWQGSGNPAQVNGVVCTVDACKRDAEVKILLGCTRDDMQIIQEFHSTASMGCTLIERPKT